MRRHGRFLTPTQLSLKDPRRTRTLIVVFLLIATMNLNGQSNRMGAPGSDESTPDFAPAPGPGEASITVMTFNLGNGSVLPAALTTYLRESGTDLVALLEVTPQIAEVLETDLADIFPYMEVRGLGIPGKALLSRHPITRAEWLELNPGRPDLHATVDIAGQPVDVLVAHPPPPEIVGFVVQPREGATEQFDRIIEIAADAEHPFLLLGDLNVTVLHQRYRELESIGLVDVFGAVGSGPGSTYPVRLQQLPEATLRPFLRIDYIWASMEWQAQTAFVGEDIGSDHLPLIAHLTLPIPVSTVEP